MVLIHFYIFYWIVAAIGLTIGYHRCVSHKDISLHPILETITIYLGTIASACSPLSWAGVHRMHHAYADTEKDPHSPKYKKWYEILFSSYKVNHIPRKFVKDLYDNPRVMFFHRYKIHVFIITYAIAFYVNPIFLMYLVLLLPTSFIFYGLLNLVGHDENGATNKWWINLFAPFEGNHTEHHAKK
jgi:stearoyl-CoA desaturase (delta-9 desaturase)